MRSFALILLLAVHATLENIGGSTGVLTTVLPSSVSAFSIEQHQPRIWNNIRSVQGSRRHFVCPQSSSPSLSTSSSWIHLFKLSQRSDRLEALSLSSSSSSTSNTDTEQTSRQKKSTFDEQQLKDIYSKFCNEDGFISKATLETMPPFSEMLIDGDLLPQELTDVWDAASTTSSGDKKEVIDFNSFLQVYNDIDDMFEDDDDDVDWDGDDDETTTTMMSKDEEDDDVAAMDSELVMAFESLSNDEGLVSRDSLRAWDEIANLFSEGLLGEDEFESLWNRISKSVGSKDSSIDSDGFLAFNMALDELFEFEEDDLDEEGNDIDDIDSIIEDTADDDTPRPMVEEGDLPPGVLFANLADKDQLVGMEELGLWVELQELLEEGDLLQSELQDVYDRLVSTNGKLDEEAFLRLYDEIDSLFEEASDDEIEESDVGITTATDPLLDQANKVKEDLLAFLEIIQEGDENMMPCGLDATESDQKQVLNIVKALEMQGSNMIKQKQGNVEVTDLAGSWKLVYSSSSAMKFNKGLSGLGGSFPNGKFASLKQKFSVTKVIQDMEYTERIEVTPSSASFDVSVPGNWQLKKSMSLFTGEPSIVVQLEPERVNYGPTSMRADHWKSLGPMNMLDLTYLDENLRVMRGCTSSDTIFIWKRISEDR